MALNIKNSEVEFLASEVAKLSGTTKTEAIRQSLLDRKASLAAIPQYSRRERLQRFLELRVWPTVPPKARKRWSRDEEDRRLGYSEWGEPV
jgi:antitoxin VapB